MIRAALLLTLLSCSYLFAFATDKVLISAEPSWLYPAVADPARKPDMKSVSNGYLLEFVDHQVNIINQTEYHHFIKNIVNETGTQNASEVSVSFSPSYQTVSFHKINIIRDGEVINQLKLGDIKVMDQNQDLSGFLYNADKRAYIVLKDIRKGDKIDVSYSIKGFNPVFKGKFTQIIRFYSANPITNCFETIIADTNRNFRFTDFSSPSPPEEIRSGNTKVYHWRNPKLKLLAYESGTPSWYNQYPYTVVSEFADWTEVANWGYGLLNGYKHELPKKLQSKISDWQQKADGDQDKFTLSALRYVQDKIRYLGFEIGEHTHKPHLPSQVYEQGYGDCKDKALLLAMILRQSGVPAFVTLVSTTMRGETYKSAASPYAFDHAIVAIERESGYLFVDPTISMQRGALDENYIPDYGYGLVLKVNETALRAIEPGSIKSTYIVESLKASKDDTASLSVYTLYKGGNADNTRVEFDETSLNDIQSNYLHYYASTFPGIKMGPDITYSDDTLVNSFTVNEEYAIPGLWQKNDNGNPELNVFAKAIYQCLASPSTVSDGDTMPLAINFPNAVQYTLHLDLSTQWGLDEKEMHIKNDAYQFDFEPNIAGNKITLKYYFKSFRDHIPVSDLKQYEQNYKKMSALTQFTFTSGKKSGGPGDHRDQPNWVAIWFSALLLAPLSVWLVKINQTTIEVEYERDSGWKLGGWMIVLGISLGLGVAVCTMSLFGGEYYSHDSWELWRGNGWMFPIVVLTELGLILANWLFAAFLSYWFWTRRDIFPRMFMRFAGLLVGGNLVLLMLYLLPALASQPGLAKNGITNLIRSCVYAAIWCTYLTKSYRAKATFLKSV